MDCVSWISAVCAICNVGIAILLQPLGVRVHKVLFLYYVLGAFDARVWTQKRASGPWFTQHTGHHHIRKYPSKRFLHPPPYMCDTALHKDGNVWIYGIPSVCMTDAHTHVRSPAILTAGPCTRELLARGGPCDSPPARTLPVVPLLARGSPRAPQRPDGC